MKGRRSSHRFYISACIIIFGLVTRGRAALPTDVYGYAEETSSPYDYLADRGPHVVPPPYNISQTSDNFASNTPAPGAFNIFGGPDNADIQSSNVAGYTVGTSAAGDVLIGVNLSASVSAFWGLSDQVSCITGGTSQISVRIDGLPPGTQATFSLINGDASFSLYPSGNSSYGISGASSLNGITQTFGSPLGGTGYLSGLDGNPEAFSIVLQSSLTLSLQAVSSDAVTYHSQGFSVGPVKTLPIYLHTYVPVSPVSQANGQVTYASVSSGATVDTHMVTDQHFQTSDGSLFTAIGAFPGGFSSPFTVSVGGVILGQFNPGDSLVFANYKAALGNLLVGDPGVTSFDISGVDPLSAGGANFPIQLEFDNTQASFDVTAVPEPAYGGAVALFAVICASRRPRMKPERLK